MGPVGTAQLSREERGLPKHRTQRTPGEIKLPTAQGCRVTFEHLSSLTEYEPKEIIIIAVGPCSARLVVAATT